jgi:hypothetical protein
VSTQPTQPPTPEQAARIAELQKQIAQLEADVSPQVEPKTAPVEVQTPPQPATPKLTEKEAVEVVQKWVTEDEDYDLDQRMTRDEMIENLTEAAHYRESEISNARIIEIVDKYAPAAPRKVKQPEPEMPAYPDELLPLIQSGVAIHRDDHWFVHRCRKCGKFALTCCGQVESDASAVWHGEKKLTAYGRQAVGLDPIVVPPTAEELAARRKEMMTDAPWMKEFRGVDELQGNGTVKMFIEEVLPEGVTLLCGLPKEGKSFIAMSMVKALTTGSPMFGNPRFSVPETVPVLYLAAESGDGQLKLRCEKFGITKDKSKFICRTLSQGPMFGLDDQNIESVIRTMRPVVFLETLIRFNDGTDEDNATESAKLAQAIFRLISLGARAVIAIHHSRKDVKSNPTKEAAARGSGDTLAMADVVWLVMQDDKLFQGGKGPNEIDVVGWGRDFSPWPMRLALTKKAPKDLPKSVLTFAPGIISCIDSGDFEWVDKQERVQAAKAERQQSDKTLDQAIEELIAANPTITRAELIEETEAGQHAVRQALKRLGYSRPQGGKQGAMPWSKAQKADRG